MLLRIFLGRSLQELYTLALLQDQPTVLRCLGISLLLQPSNCTAVPIQISIVCAVFLQKELFSYFISLLIWMTTERQWIPLQRYKPMKLCLGLMGLNHWWSVQFKLHHYSPPLWGGEEQPSSAASQDSRVEKITIHSIENVSFGSSYENAIHPVHSLHAPA